MVFAGIWATRRDQGPDSWQRTCSIITAAAEGVIAPIHDRMPVSLAPETWDLWLDRDQRDTATAVGLLTAIDAEEIMEHTVSSRVNSVRNNGPELQRRADSETLF
jgi:putative SOS response-associated peptidase YedK